MRRVGPQPPDPDWDRLDFRNPNGSRQAWGYLDPTDMVIVTNEGEVFVRVEKSELKMEKGQPPTVTLNPTMRGLLRRTFRWVGIIHRMFIIEVEPIQPQDGEEKEASNGEDAHLRLKRWT
jgi:hypothetical protein